MSGNPVSEGEAGEGRVSWRRLLVGLAVTGSAAATLIVLSAQGVLAASFSVSGRPFTVTADKLEGTGFEQFATLDKTAAASPNAGGTGGQRVLIVSAIKEAKLTKLCQSIDLGGTHLRITAGDDGSPVTATNLVVDSDLVSGDATFTKIEIGRDAGTLNKVPSVNGRVGVFGQQADSVTIMKLRQNNFSTTAATFRLVHLHMNFGTKGC